MARPLLLFPFNGTAREAVGVVAALNAQSPQWELLGFVDDNPALTGVRFGGFPVLGGREVFQRHPEAQVMVLSGRPDNYFRRPEVIASLNLDPARYATLIHPSACLGVEVTIGRNVLIQANAVLTGGNVLGDHVVLLPGVVVGHDTHIGDYTLVGSLVSVAGGVTVGAGCYLGSGSRIIHEVTLGDGCLVGLGAVVIDHVLPAVVVAGVPARVLAPKPGE